MSWVDWLTDPSGLTPHGFCLAWSPWLIGVHAGSDLLTGLAYYSIPLALAVFVRRRTDLVFSWMFWLFAAFILACGTTHFLAVATLWIPAYGIEGAVKMITALLSLITAAALWPLLPAALALPSPNDLRALNTALGKEVEQREAVAVRLRESEARFRALYAKTPAPLLAADPNRRIVAVSDRLVELLKTPRETLIGQDVVGLGAGDSAVAIGQAWQTLLEVGSLRDSELRLRGPAGAQIDVQLSAALERDAGGAVLAVAVVTDITGRKTAELALRTAQESLNQAQKMEAIGQLTGGIAHDFNNMLTVIGGSLEVVRRQGQQAAGADRLLDLAQQSVDKAARLTSQLLSFSRQQRLEPAALDPRAVISGMRALLERTLGERIALVVDAPAGPAWRCLADRNQLESALLNLALNARAAIPATGTLWIDIAEHRVVAGPGADGAVPPADALAPGDYVAIAVTDDGAGIDPALHASIFEPFFTTKPRGQGTGLGLAQTYGFVRQSGGAMRLTSAPGQGARFELWLPRATGPAGIAETPGPAAASQAGRGETILLVEDEPALRELATVVLAAAGFHVLAAADGATAVALLDAQNAVRLLFTDIVMPGAYDGVQLALKARCTRPDLPVLFATGYADRSRFAAWEGPARLLAKPYTPEALVSEVRASLDAMRRPAAV